MYKQTVCALLAFFAMTGCTNNPTIRKPENHDMKTITGTVWYRERMLLPPTSQIHVILENIAKMDAPSEVIADTVLQPQGGPPWRFSLNYEPTRIQANGRYALRARIEDNNRLLFINTTHVPAFEGASGAPVDIMVSRVGAQARNHLSVPTKPNASLTDSYWKLVEINGKPAELGAGQREVHLVLDSKGNRVHGFSGCNQFSGSFEQDDNHLQFKQMLSTMMACLEGGELERSFLEGLQATRKFSVNGDQLTLYDSNDRVILKFAVVHLR